jgi:hypothetical protein
MGRLSDFGTRITALFAAGVNVLHLAPREAPVDEHAAPFVDLGQASKVTGKPADTRPQFIEAAEPDPDAHPRRPVFVTAAELAPPIRLVEDKEYKVEGAFVGVG